MDPPSSFLWHCHVQPPPPPPPMQITSSFSSLLKFFIFFITCSDLSSFSSLVHIYSLSSLLFSPPWGDLCSWHGHKTNHPSFYDNLSIGVVWILGFFYLVDFFMCQYLSSSSSSSTGQLKTTVGLYIYSVIYYKCILALWANSCLLRTRWNKMIIMHPTDLKIA